MDGLTMSRLVSIVVLTLLYSTVNLHGLPDDAFPERDDICVSLAVSNAVLQPSINGQYDMDRTFNRHCADRPTWRKVGSNHTFVYYMEDSYDGWMIGATSCYSWGNFLAAVKSNSPTPYSAVEIWKESDLLMGLVDSAAVSVQCIKFDSCFVSPCQHGGTCVAGNLPQDDVTCICAGYYSGVNCAAWNPMLVYTTYQKKTLCILIVAGIIMTATIIAATLLLLRHRRRTELRKIAVDDKHGERDSSLRYKRLQDEASASQTSLVNI